MLRSYLELSADVIPHELAEEFVAFVAHHVVEPYSRADEDLFYFRYLLHLGEQLYVLAVVGDEVLARLRDETSPARTYAVGELFFTRGSAEVCRRPSDIVNVSLEVRKGREQLRLVHYGFNAA